MTARCSRLLLTATATAGAIALGSTVAPALSVRSAPQKITPTGVGAVKLGKSYTSLRSAGLVGKIGPGCELAGPGARSASLRAPLKGSVDFTRTTPRRVTTIAIRGGATARGVGIGASLAKVRQAFPKAIIDRRTEATFAITLVKIPSNGGGRMQFAVDTKTKKVTLIGVPRIAFCE